uniref:EB domain-containing protein n=1 Tax=Romanomermis culicivorax TaxID=13658 RepID=A0A915JTR0_ROMCU
MKCVNVERRVSSKSLKPGIFCEHDHQCSEHSLCINNVCQCKDGFAFKDDECQSYALPTRHKSVPGDPCNDFSDCTGNSYCRLGYCVCPLGTESINMMCFPSMESYQRIDVSNQSISTDGAPRSLNQPFSLEPGNPCIIGQLCVNGSVCALGLCRCAAGLQQIGNKCFSKKIMLRPGHVCSYGQHCAGGSSCIAGICQCISSHVLKGDTCVYK